jgi:hypothetical protein
MKSHFRIHSKVVGSLLILLSVLCVPTSGFSQAPEVKFGDVTAKFVRNMKLLRTLTSNPELGLMIDNVVGKAEDMQSYNNDKNADEKRLRIMKQMDTMLQRDGIKQSDQSRLEKLQTELQELDPDNKFQKARAEMNRSLGEMQNFLGQIHSPDPRSEDVVRLIRMHVTFYNRCLSKMN